MQELRLDQRIKQTIDLFISGLRDVYNDALVSVIIYGSASSGEFIERHSNLNLLVILKDTGLDNLKKASRLAGSSKFRMINPLFFTEDYIRHSCDVFPIEFMDMRENYAVLYGKDVLKDIRIDLKNLRFQCEHELKAKLINIKLRYLAAGGKKSLLEELLLKSFVSVIHILRSVLKLKGRQPAYRKTDVLKELADEFKIDAVAWGKILAARNKQVKLNSRDVEQLFAGFMADLERITEAIDKL
ncbi:MAG: hypothetical protein ACM3IL_02510 [Deltaproteobacteria bacterium]